VVGEWENSASPYGTFDQSGNVWEWNEGIVSDLYRGIKGGAFSNVDASPLEASNRINSLSPASHRTYLGFRVVQVVPEPSSIMAMLGGLTAMGGLVLRKRK